jgi:hypothetical protein
MADFLSYGTHRFDRDFWAFVRATEEIPMPYPDHVFGCNHNSNQDMRVLGARETARTENEARALLLASPGDLARTLNIPVSAIVIDLFF